jgi:hypothetical protein
MAIFPFLAIFFDKIYVEAKKIKVFFKLTIAVLFSKFSGTE